MLGNAREALIELERVGRGSSSHPIALTVLWKALSAAERWEDAYRIAEKLALNCPDLPYGPVCMAQALGEQGQLAAAKIALLKGERICGGDLLILYNLACCCCRLGERHEAQEWLEKALLRGGADMLRAASIDPDLKPLQPQLRKLARANVQNRRPGPKKSRFT